MICNKCKQNKDKSEFYRNQRTKDGYNHICKECYSKIRAEKRNKENKLHVEEKTFWTVSALMCYSRRCNCEGCFYESFFRHSNISCRMRESIEMLLEKYGKPKIKVTGESLIKNIVQNKELLQTQWASGYIKILEENRISLDNRMMDAIAFLIKSYHGLYVFYSGKYRGRTELEIAILDKEYFQEYLKNIPYPENITYDISKKIFKILYDERLKNVV